MQWTDYAWAFGTVIVMLELALAWAMKADARDGTINFPWISKVAYWVHKVASYAMIVPDMLMPFGIKPQVPVLAAIKRYKELTAQVHVDDLKLEPWEERSPQ